MVLRLRAKHIHINTSLSTVFKEKKQRVGGLLSLLCVQTQGVTKRPPSSLTLTPVVAASGGDTATAACIRARQSHFSTPNRGCCRRRLFCARALAHNGHFHNFTARGVLFDRRRRLHNIDVSISSSIIHYALCLSPPKADKNVFMCDWHFFSFECRSRNVWGTN
jgi:hypothetical protein